MLLGPKETLILLTSLTLGCGSHPLKPGTPDLAGVALVDLAGTPPGADLAGAPPGADLALPVGKLCSDPRADGYPLPATKPTSSGLLTASLVAGDPSPPIIGTNSWTLQLTDHSGAPVSGATITAKPWMPDHGHGTSVTPTVMAAAAAGQYTVGPLYFFMAGLWQVTFSIQQGSAMDQVVFSVCLADL
jgi:hypothetical protein